MIEVKNLIKTYRPKKGKEVQALKGINLQLEDKGLVFILGKSGSGKSTLLNMLGGLDQFDEGEIIVKGKSSKDFAQSDFDSYRNTFIGFIFQEYNILNDFTVGANIALAMELQGKKPSTEMLSKILREVDLEGFANRKPNELSGGQKQRVAIARALIKNPEIIMADEPTGALDSNTGKQVFDTLKKLSEDKLVIVVSHDREFAEQYGDRVIEMKDGNVISDIKKYTAKSSNVNEGIQVIDDKILHIKSGYELTSMDLQMINEYLKKNKEQDTFISLDLRTNEKIKQVAQIDENGNQQAFTDTTNETLNIEQYEGSKLKFIKSKLPFRSSFKMAAGSLKKKPFRLAMTVLLSTVSFSLFGLVNTMSSYDKINSGTDSIIDSKVDYIAFTKEKEVNQGQWSYYTQANLLNEDIENIEKQFPNNKFTKVTNVSGNNIDFDSNISDLSKLNPYGSYAFYPSSFAGAASITDDVIKNMGYTISGNLPKKDNEIVITKLTAESFLQGGYLNPNGEEKGLRITSVNDMIGKQIRLSVNSDELYTITGILDTNFDGSRYEMFTKEKDPTVSGMSVYMLQSEHSEVLINSYHTLMYTNEQFFEQIKSSNVGAQPYGMNYDITLKSDDDYYMINSLAEFSKLSDEMKSKVVFFDESKQGLEKGEIILPLSIIEQNPKVYTALSNVTTLEDMKKALQTNQKIIQELKMQVEVFSLANDWNSETNQVEIAGIYIDTDSMNPSMLVTADGFFEKYDISEMGKYTTVLGNMPKDRKEIQNVVTYSFDNGIDGVIYSLRNSTSSLLDSVNSLVEEARDILLIVGIGFAIFAGLMLMNFISTSIAYRKREIGILRAVGARGRDVFSIFFQESTLIALINWVFAVGATAAVVSCINMIFRNDYNFVVTIFHFGITQVILMLVLSLFVAFVASFFPVYNVAKKKPIEVIRKN